MSISPSGHSHSFDRGLAIELGIEAAIVYNHILYWLNINASKKDAEMIEEKYWMYETQKEIADYLGYMGEDQVQRAIKKLVESGLLIKGNFNKTAFDRTNWYTVSNQNLILIKKSNTKPQNYGMAQKSAKTGCENSKNVYETANQRNPFCTGAESTYKQYNKQEEQQQQPAAASFKIAPSLETIDIPSDDKIWLTKNFPDSKISLAVAYATSPNVIINTTLQQTIKWYCQLNDPPEIPKEQKKQAEDNKKVATEIAKKAILPSGIALELCTDHVEIVYTRCQKEPTCIKYDEKGFGDQLENAIRKAGGVIRQI